MKFPGAGFMKHTQLGAFRIPTTYVAAVKVQTYLSELHETGQRPWISLELSVDYYISMDIY